MSNYLVYGAGGHARVIADAIGLNDDAVLAYFDDQIDATATQDIPVISYNSAVHHHAKVVIGVGNNAIRRDIAKYIVHDFGRVIHPKAIIAKDVIIGAGSVVLAGAVLQAGVIIGRHVVVNANVTIDHDAVIGDFCSIYPNTYIGGNATIGSGNTLDAGTVVKRSVRIPAIFSDEIILDAGLSKFC